MNISQLQNNAINRMTYQRRKHIYIAYIGTFIELFCITKKLIYTCMLSLFILILHQLIFNLQTRKLIWAIDLKLAGIHICSRNEQLRYKKRKHLVLGLLRVWDRTSAQEMAENLHPEEKLWQSGHWPVKLVPT